MYLKSGIIIRMTTLQIAARYGDKSHAGKGNLYVNEQHFTLFCHSI